MSALFDWGKGSKNILDPRPNPNLNPFQPEEADDEEEKDPDGDGLDENNGYQQVG